MQTCCENTCGTACHLDHVKPKKPAILVAMIGNPNGGKTTLFNALTGANQHIGNRPGVTVECKRGFFTFSRVIVEVVDLPGIYSLVTQPGDSAVDERITAEFLAENAQKIDVIINIVDASHLERHLYLTMQLLERGLPVVLALNMMDVARSRRIHVDMAGLSEGLGCPVVALEANKGSGLYELKQALLAYQDHIVSKAAPPIVYPQIIEAAVHTVTEALCAIGPTAGPDAAGPDAAGPDKAWVLRLLEEDDDAKRRVPPPVLTTVQEQQTLIRKTTGAEADVLVADARYRHVQALLQSCVSASPMSKPSWTARLDSIVLNRWLGIPIFFAMMYLLFVFSINVGGAFQDFFDISSQVIFVDGFANVLTKLGAPSWLTALLANGLGKGINTTVTFIPVIGFMFFFLAVLEDSGYMARAAFVVDRLMRALGLPGKAFVPMIVGFGCNVPAVMGARTLESRRDRILTIMMTPFMSCGARLTIYTVFTTAFFPHGGQNIVFLLYLIGIFMAILTGFLLRNTLLQGRPSPLVMELPRYHLPHGKTLFLHTWQRLKGFVYRAGKLIVPICVLIGALNTLNLDGSMNTGEGGAHSLLSLLGRWATPLFAPMGIRADNWPATVGLLTGVLAKEVVVGTLNTLYSQAQAGAMALAPTVSGGFDLWTGLSQALCSIPHNLSHLVSMGGGPLLAQAAPADGIQQSVYGTMVTQFDGRIGAFAYLLFVLLYFPCVSTMAVMTRELHRGWSIFSALWMTGTAYGTAVVFYQAATFFRHPLPSTFWMSTMLAAFLLTLILIRRDIYQPAVGK